ncbi:hypothetical protein G6F65_019854 [Rhizopus arrhizus]|nr:hypothetical protein G6F65_019854 [Rhizopus arrhizus]
MPLWATTTCMPVGSPTTQPSGRMPRERQVDRLLARHGQEFRHQRQRAGNEPLHVAAAAPIEQPVFLDELERVRAPVLAIHGHHVGVARQDDAALLVAVLRRQSGEQVGLGALGVVRQPRIDALAFEPIADGFDQGKIGIAAGGIETHQRFQPGARVHVTSLLGENGKCKARKRPRLGRPYPPFTG